MAKRRMFSLDVVDTDKFLDMPASAQALYFHLGMRADDDGFVSAPKKIVAMCNSCTDDLRILMSKKYVIPFESGVCVITDWKRNNTLKNDRYTPTEYIEEKSRIVTENGVYRMCAEPEKIAGSKMDPSWNRIGSKMDPQDSIGKVSIDKGSIDNKAGDNHQVNQKLKEDKTPKVIPPSVSPPTALSVLRSFGFAGELESTVKDWLTYKHEKRQDYKTVGLNTLLGQIAAAAEKYGDEAVIQVIRNSMASNYQGITFDRLTRSEAKKPDRLSWIDEVVLE